MPGLLQFKEFYENEASHTFTVSAIFNFGKSFEQKNSQIAIGAYSNQSITKKLAQSFGIAKKSAKKGYPGTNCNEEVKLKGYVSDR
jgi:hypothetical protein